MSKTILTKEQEQEIVKKYLLGQSKNSLHLEYKVSEGTIKRALLRNNIYVRQIADTNITHYNINHSFFDKNLLDENGAYILGLFAADGYVSKKDNCVTIELKADDKNILEDINLLLENERPIKTYSRDGRNDTSKLYFFSKKIKDDLCFFNIVPNKTYLDIDFTEKIPEKFFFDFIRGFFDGDGSVVESNGTVRWQLDGSSLKTFEMIQNKFFEYDIELKIREEFDKRSTIPKYRLYCYSKERCKRIFNLLYNTQSKLRLERKYDKFFNLVQ